MCPGTLPEVQQSQMWALPPVCCHRAPTRFLNLILPRRIGHIRTNNRISTCLKFWIFENIFIIRPFNFSRQCDGLEYLKLASSLYPPAGCLLSLDPAPAPEIACDARNFVAATTHNQSHSQHYKNCPIPHTPQPLASAPFSLKVMQITTASGHYFVESCLLQSLLFSKFHVLPSLFSPET